MRRLGFEYGRPRGAEAALIAPNVMPLRLRHKKCRDDIPAPAPYVGPVTIAHPPSTIPMQKITGAGSSHAEFVA